MSELEQIEGLAPRRFRAYPEYKDSGLEWLGTVPSRWQVVALGRLIARIEQGWSPVAEDRPASIDEWAVIKLGAVSKGRFRQEEHKRLPTDLSPDKRYEIREGDLLLTRANTPNLVGDVCIVRQPRPGLMLCDLVYRLQIRQNKILSDYLAYWLLSTTGRFQIEVDARGSSKSMVKVSHGLVRAWSVVLPPLPEQRAIATFLDLETKKIDELIAKKQRLIELLKENRSAVLYDSVTGGQSGEADGAATGRTFLRIPHDAEMRKLRRLIRQVKRPVRVDSDSEYREIGIRSWGKGIFHKEPVRGALLEGKRIYRIEPDDFVLNIVFAWEGAVARAREAERGMVASHRFPTFRCSPEIDLHYLLIVLRTEQGRALMEFNSPGAAGRNKTLRINQFLDEEIPLPPLDHQREVVSMHRAHEKQSLALERKIRDAIDHLKELRAALISAAVTGKIDVRTEGEEEAA